MVINSWVRAAQVGLIIGLMVLIAGIWLLVNPGDPNAAPKCDGQPMIQGDTCIEHFGDGSTQRRDYASMKGHRNAAVPPLMILIGACAAGGSAVVWRRKRVRPFEFQFAPFHITEKK
ncbi:hypothetical protein ABH920_006415 [Catenulispora sp. EB89]|uniref:hypothetical protein n=1 Tax=Catenulispora sp. EB89 TaxID=3156257 RepID=UPI00351459A9